MTFLRITVLFVLTSMVTLAVAEDYSVGDIRVILPWARATPPVTNTGAGSVEVTMRVGHIDGEEHGHGHGHSH